MSQNDYQNQALATLRIGLVYHDWREYRKALGIYQKAFNLCDSIGNQLNAGACLKNTAMIYERLQEYDIANICYQRAAQYYSSFLPADNELVAMA